MDQQLAEIHWDKIAWNQLQELHKYISKKSLQNANRVRLEILEKVNKIPSQPTRFGLDNYKNNNDGTYRYFELYHQRIAFRVNAKVIKIMMVRSTYQEPTKY